MRRVDLLVKVAACERALARAADPRRRLALELLRDMWTSLAVEGQALSRSQRRADLALVARIHARMLKTGRP